METLREISEYLFDEAMSEPNLYIRFVANDIEDLTPLIKQVNEIYFDTEKSRQAVRSINNSQRAFTFFNGSVIQFLIFECQQDCKSGVSDYLVITKAVAIEKKHELIMRTKITYWII